MSRNRTPPPIRELTITMLEALDESGAMTCKALAEKMAKSVSAIEARLATVIEKEIILVDKTLRPRLFSVAPDWRMRVEDMALPAERLAPTELGGLNIKYAGCPPPGAPQKITGPLAPTVWRGLSHLVPA